MVLLNYFSLNIYLVIVGLARIMNLLLLQANLLHPEREIFMMYIAQYKLLELNLKPHNDK